MGGAHFRADRDFVNAAIRDVQLLQQHAGLTRDSRLLDWGCGAGRLSVGIKHTLGHVTDYHGVDVQPRLLNWAAEHLSDANTRFTLVDQHNERYNPNGSVAYDIPSAPDSVDVLYAYSVFSHMLARDVRGYAETIAQILTGQGRAVMTAFVENDVADCVENPPDYRKLDWKGRLHCVRYDRHYFESMLWDAGLAVDEFVYGRETDGQSLYSLRLRSNL